MLEQIAIGFLEFFFTVAYLTVQVLMKEYHTLELSMEKRVAELENTLSEKKVKLETYERLEKELDDVVMQAAEGNVNCPQCVALAKL